MFHMKCELIFSNHQNITAKLHNRHSLFYLRQKRLKYNFFYGDQLLLQSEVLVINDVSKMSLSFLIFEKRNIIKESIVLSEYFNFESLAVYFRHPKRESSDVSLNTLNSTLAYYVNVANIKVIFSNTIIRTFYQNGTHNLNVVKFSAGTGLVL